MSSLSHHGIKGQRWGVRRFQNKDGTRTAAGKARDYKKARELKQKAYDHYDKYGPAWRNKPVAAKMYLKAEKLEDPSITPNESSAKANAISAQTVIDAVNLAEAIRSDPALSDEDRAFYEDTVNQYLHKAAIYSYISDDIRFNLEEKGKPITDREKDWNDYTSRQKEYLKKRVKDGDTWLHRYEQYISLPTAKHTSIGGTMYIEGNALILGDSSYLEHHGIKGQRWGVRRFQNRDGSLTNAGRKRLGYATKGAAQTVGKAFKAGVKAGGNAVKAVKAHHEKKEAEKLEKKKEKASKTRLGVMANKDLFTNEELKKLNDRFKLEDEMKMATLQKGVEIAKAIGTIAQNVGTVAKAYEDVTGTSLSPIKRKAAEEKAKQDKEDRERRLAREDADEARKAAKEERDIAIHEQTLRKAIASADTQEFTARKTKAEADSSILDLYKKGQDSNGGTDATGQSWVEKAKSSGKNPFDDMIANRDPEYAQIRKEHDEKVARKERIAELERREKERQAEKASKNQALNDMINASDRKRKGGQPSNDSDALFSQKGSLPLDKDRYKNSRAAEKAKQVKENAAEERAKKQDDKAAKATIDDMIEANRSFKEIVRAQDPHAYDRGVAKDYIKGKIDNLPNVLADLNPINRAAKKIADKATKEEEAQVRKNMKDQYDQMVKSEGRDEANYVMYQTRVANLQQQGYSERKAKQIADSDPTFSAKRNRKVEYSQKVKDLDATHRKNSKEIDKANRELTDYYYKLINGPGYDPGTPKREALDRKYRQKRGELERLEKDNNDMLEKGMKEAKKILEHSFTIQNGVLFVDSSDGLAHHGIKGQRWGVRRFQNKDGTRTALGKKREMYGATVSVRGQKSSESVGVTKKQAKGKAAAEILKSRNDLSEKERKKLQKHVDRAEKETAKLEKYKEKKKRSQEENTEEEKVKQWDMMTSGMISPDRYKQNIDTINKNHKREIDYLNKMDERDMANEKAFSRKTVAKGMGFALAATAGLAGITAAATGWAVISGHAAIGGGMVGVISGEMKRGQYRDQRRKEMGIDDPGRGKVKDSVYARHDAFTIQNGTLFINAGEPYLEHHGVKGMKWGKHLMAGKGEAGAGGGAGEDDEKLKEMAKKAGMSVAEYKQKFASKLGGAASKVGEKVYDAAGGKYKTQAAEAHREMVQKRNDADDKARRANAQGRAANAQKRAGNVREYMANKEGARQLDAEAKGARTSQWEATKKANRAQWKYDHSIAGLYDKATGKYKQAHKKTAIPKTMDRWMYEYKDGPNSKLFNNGKGKAKTAKDQAKAEVWNAADHQIKAKEYNDVANSVGGNANYYGQAYKNAAEREGRLSEASYRRAAALGKQASSESSTSSRPRARKKKHTSGGSGVAVRRPGRKPVSRTKRVTQSSTGVKRRGSTGSGRSVRRGA